jgi:alcohol dehydrogenase class IV
MNLVMTDNQAAGALPWHHVHVTVLDPELTLSCPAAQTLSAAIDSLVHATEAFVAKKSNPWARLFAFNGFNLVAKVVAREFAAKHDPVSSTTCHHCQ